MDCYAEQPWIWSAVGSARQRRNIVGVLELHLDAGSLVGHGCVEAY